MSHASKRTTEIYFNGGKEVLTDDDYVPVRAPMTLRELGIKG